MTPLLKNLLVALAIVFVAGCVYYFLPSSQSVDESGSLMESDAVRQTARILADTKKIDEFKVDGDLLKDPHFKSLKENNIDAELTDVGTGRTNPFEDVR